MLDVVFKYFKYGNLDFRDVDDVQPEVARACRGQVKAFLVAECEIGLQGSECDSIFLIAAQFRSENAPDLTRHGELNGGSVGKVAFQRESVADRVQLKGDFRIYLQKPLHALQHHRLGGENTDHPFAFFIISDHIRNFEPVAGRNGQGYRNLFRIDAV
ncbi:hypothetical protein DSECCO2_658470 [anaerobic digester metagenome]